MEHYFAFQSDRKKNPIKYRFRFMCPDEVKNLKSGERPYVLLNSGKVGQVKINGTVKRWKRDSDRVEVPIKYGMYEYDSWNAMQAINRFVVRLEDGE